VWDNEIEIVAARMNQDRVAVFKRLLSGKDEQYRVRFVPIAVTKTCAIRPRI